MRYLLWCIILICSIPGVNDAQSVGGNTSGSTSFCGPVNSGFISLSGYSGTILHWESSNNNGLSWTYISNPTNTQNYNNLSQTTWFRAIVQNGSAPQDTSTISVITVYQQAFAGQANGGGPFCVSAPAGTLSLTGNVGQVSYWESSINAGVSWTVLTVTTTILSYPVLTQNTWYRAIVTNVSGCPSDTSAPAKFEIFQNTIVGTLFQSDTVCKGDIHDTLHITGQLGNVTDWFSSVNGGAWTPLGNTNTWLAGQSMMQTTSYKVVLKNGACSSATTTPVTIVVVNANAANAGPDKMIVQYESTTLEGSGDGTPEWGPSPGLNNPDIFTPQASPLQTTTYVLTLTDSHGCTSQDSMQVKVYVPLPTAITPNGDDVNDYFLVDKIDQYPENTFTVFNRWGTIVYKESPYANQWNGKSRAGQELPDGIYYYTLDYGTGEKPTTGYVLIKR
ncbi:MAG: gliding motility-associated C-terminal domain-containing protein [Bacteroidetes bacterium]|nr:gliding motility-associated C-terminal domain-containing protein [Bacteroidota bacterium]